MIVSKKSGKEDEVVMEKGSWTGVYPATLCPFNKDYSIDNEGLREYCEYLVSVEGIEGLVCNGHTGEIMSLLPRERAEVTKILSAQVGDRVKVITGISAEGSFEAIEHVKAAEDSGADAILLMPPHHWLRFGRSEETAIGYFQDVADSTNLSIIVHQYPNWTKASYSLKEMLEIVKIRNVVSIKMGTREMSRYVFDYRELKAAAPNVSILTCHDEYLLSTLMAGADGALVGFAGFVPELIVALTKAALNNDYDTAYSIEEKVFPLKNIVYRFGEPSSDAHQRMKYAMTLMGLFPSDRVRPPLRPLCEEDQSRIKDELIRAGYNI